MAKLITVTDPGDPRLDDYVRLRDSSLRKHLEVERGLFIAEGEKVISRALSKGMRPRSLLLAKRWLPGIMPLLAPFPDVSVFVVTESLAEDVTGFHVHRGALAAIQRPSPRPVAELLNARRLIGLEDIADHTDDVQGDSAGSTRSRIAILEDLVDHTNVGACFRSAAAMGVDAILVTPGCADPLYRRSVKVSMGTVFQVPWTRVDDWPESIELIKEAGYFVAGMSLGEGSITLDELAARDHQNLALVFGTEGHGLTPATDRLLDAKVTIPMLNGVDSLNVAASSAVAFYATR